MPPSSRPSPAAMSPRPLPEEFGDFPIVMAQIDGLMRQFAATLPDRRRRLVSNAVLNLAVNRLAATEGPERAATILYRLAELVAGGREPQGGDAFPLTSLDA